MRVWARDWLVVSSIGLGIGWAAVFAARSDVLPALILVPLSAAVFIYLAIVRFELFTLFMIATRTSIELLPIALPGDLLRISVIATGAYTLAAVVFLVRSKRGFHPSPLAWAVIGVAIAGMISAGLSRSPLQAGMGASRWLFLSVFVLVMESLTGPLAPLPLERFVRRALMAFAASMVVPLAVGGWQMVSAFPSVVTGSARITGSLAHPNTLGFYLVVMILGLLAIAPGLIRRARFGTYLLAAIATVELAATYSRTSAVALAAGIVILIVVGRRWLLPVGLVGAIVVAALLPGISQRWEDLDESVSARGTPGNALAWRVDYWESVVDASEEQRVTGLGLGVVSQTTEQGREPHNDFVRALAELGVVGLLAYLALLVVLVWRATAGLVATPRSSETISRGIAEGYVAITTAFLVGSVTGNLMTQLVLLWYVLGFAVIARASVGTHRSGIGAGRSHV